MSGMMLKMVADFLKVEPEEILQKIETVESSIREGVELLSSIDSRIKAIESHLGIEREENAEIEES